MTAYVALLRGVNLGKRQLKMDALRALATQLGLANARTYIASGNLLFDSDESEAMLKARLEAAIGAHMGAAVPVMIRSASEMAAVAQANPFAGEPGNTVVAIFLDSAPPSDPGADAKHVASERIAAGKREIHVHYPAGQGPSRLVISRRGKRYCAQHEHGRETRRACSGAGMSKLTRVRLDCEGEALESIFVGRRDDAARPAVILFPTVRGVSDLEIGFGRQLVELGYCAFVADVFGTRFKDAPGDVMMAEMGRLKGDRAGLRRRVTALFEQARGLDGVDASGMAAAGFCFGGLCALDLARGGAALAGVASFHGLLDPPGLPSPGITAKILVFHGWDDPLAAPQAMVALAEEMTAAGADWQVHAYGGVGHAFTNPRADGSTPGLAYDALAAERSWTSLINFLEELFGDHG